MFKNKKLTKNTFIYNGLHQIFATNLGKLLKFKKIPIAATPFRLRDLFRRSDRIVGGRDSAPKGTTGFNLDGAPFFPAESPLKQFREYLVEYLQIKHCFLVNSGTAAFYLALKAISSISDKDEVILPAYTAPALVLPIKKLGLKVRLCEINLDTFNIDVDVLPRLISGNTLCILAVHLFGAPCEIQTIIEMAKGKDIFVLEDAAQAQGARLNDRLLGTFGDIGFFSFNRGKNLPTYSGGCIVTDLKELADIIEEEMGDLNQPSLFFKSTLPFKLTGLSLATRPYFYGLFYPFIQPFKSKEVPAYFTISKYTDIQARLGISLLEKFPQLNEKRFQNGMFLINALRDVQGMSLPRISADAQPVFNRLSVLFRDLERRKEVETRLRRAGIETSRLYLKPLHHIFDLGYKDQDFPNATYFAQHLLTLPVHPLVTEEDLWRIIEAIRAT